MTINLINQLRHCSHVSNFKKKYPVLRLF